MLSLKISSQGKDIMYTYSLGYNYFTQYWASIWYWCRY